MAQDSKVYSDEMREGKECHLPGLTGREHPAALHPSVGLSSAWGRSSPAPELWLSLVPGRSAGANCAVTYQEMAAGAWAASSHPRC